MTCRRAKAFYTEVFGWTPNDFDMGGMQYTEWRLGEKPVAGMMTMPDMVPAEVPAHWLVYFGTDDTDATVAMANKLGATTLVPPTDIPPGRFSVLMDSGRGYLRGDQDGADGFLSNVYLGPCLSLDVGPRTATLR